MAPQDDLLMHSTAPQQALLGEDAFSSGLDSVPVLDSAGAIALMDDSEELYIEIAQAFQHELSQLPATLQASLLQADLGAAARTLHTFKGLSLTVGAQRLSEVCRRFEQTLKTLHAQSQSLPPALQSTLTAVLLERAQQTGEALDHYFQQRLKPCSQTTSEHPEQQHQAIIEKLQELLRLLRQSDLAALDVFAALHTSQAEKAAQMQALSLALKALDFPQAMVQCDELIRKFGPTAP